MAEKIKAFLFGKTLPGMEEQVIQSLNGVEEVKNAQLILGEHDIVAEFEIENYEDLKQVLLEKVRTIKGIERTKTYIAAETFEK